jgi:hypothetical protein
MNKKKTFGDYFNKGTFTVYEIDYKNEKVKTAKIELKLTKDGKGREYGTFIHRGGGGHFMFLSKKDMEKMKKDSRTSGEFLYEEDAQKELKKFIGECIEFYEKKLVEWKEKIKTL